MTFDPKAHIRKLPRGGDYLEVKWRLVWMREEHPDWGIATEIVALDDAHAIVKATVSDPAGSVLATGHKREDKQHFADYLEKAETGSVGRALALVGYGTQFADELDEGERIVDSPVGRPAKPAPPASNGKAEYSRDGLEMRWKALWTESATWNVQPPAKFERPGADTSDAQLDLWIRKLETKLNEVKLGAETAADNLAAEEAKKEPAHAK